MATAGTGSLARLEFFCAQPVTNVSYFWSGACLWMQSCYSSTYQDYMPLLQLIPPSALEFSV